MKRVSWIVVLAISMASPAFSAEGGPIYCPWADTVVRITPKDGGTSVEILSGLSNVPKLGVYPSLAGKRAIGQADLEIISFVILSEDYTYNFELQKWDSDHFRLENTRVRKSDQRTWTEDGTCLVEGS